MLTASCPLHLATWDPDKSFELVARLNSLVSLGHFEVNVDGSLISFITWKHLTNDLRFYALDELIASVHEAARLLGVSVHDHLIIGKDRHPRRPQLRRDGILPLRFIEREIGERWHELETDSPLAFGFNEKALQRREELGRRFQQALAVRARLG